MNRRFISVLLFAFVVAGGASMVLYRLVIAHMGSSAPVQATSSVLVATKNLDLGAVIGDADLRVATWPGAPPQGTLTKAADAVGRGVIAPIFANEPLTETRLGVRGAGGGLAATIPAGMRAVAIRVNEVVGLAGFVVAGTHVDVLVSGTSPGAAGAAGNEARTLLQNISVLSAGQDFKKDAEGKPVTVQVVNLLVTPEQAEMLSLASTQMTIQLVLRNPLDVAVTTTRGVTLASIFSGQPPPKVAPSSPQPSRRMPFNPPPVAGAAAVVAPPPLLRIEMIQGNKRTEYQIQKRDVRP